MDSDFTKSKADSYDQLSVFTKYTNLSQKLKAVNLGHGFPDYTPPEFFVQNLAKHVLNGYYQYTPGKGCLSLLQEIAKKWGKFYNREINPNTEVMVTNGAVAALNAIITAFTEPGDEGITLEPFFNCYDPQLEFSGGKLIGLPLIPPSKKRDRKEYENISGWKKGDSDQWSIDFEGLKRLVNKKTRFLILNSPNNPTGKIITIEEYKEIIKIIKDFPRIIIILDEVYEFHIFNEEYLELPRMQTIPEMWDRCVSIHSAGKIFSVTGTRMSWMIGPDAIIRKALPVMVYSNWSVFEPMQLAFLDTLKQAEEPYQGYKNYYEYIRLDYRKLRDLFIEGLAKNKDFEGEIYLPDGGFFSICNISKVDPYCDKVLEGDENSKEPYTKDYKYTLNMAYDKGVIAIPCSSLYTKANVKFGQNFIRFAFCKKVETLDLALKRLDSSQKI